MLVPEKFDWSKSLINQQVEFDWSETKRCLKDEWWKEVRDDIWKTYMFSIKREELVLKFTKNFCEEVIASFIKCVDSLPSSYKYGMIQSVLPHVRTMVVSSLGTRFTTPGKDGVERWADDAYTSHLRRDAIVVALVGPEPWRHFERMFKRWKINILENFFIAEVSGGVCRQIIKTNEELKVGSSLYMNIDNLLNGCLFGDVIPCLCRKYGFVPDAIDCDHMGRIQHVVDPLIASIAYAYFTLNASLERFKRLELTITPQRDGNVNKTFIPVLGASNWWDWKKEKLESANMLANGSSQGRKEIEKRMKTGDLSNNIGYSGLAYLKFTPDYVNEQIKKHNLPLVAHPVVCTNFTSKADYGMIFAAFEIELIK